ncbi:DUF3604 domain-containing protein [Haloarcula halophila]|uniref:DUF3604 domain-containing protein n=1 Tax=Haloarcula TaxID=2237 RepID=UPI0023E416B1|nr:DUF3604 domain-containing protein [Halomicroarcula sp. DFY41]
MSVLAKFAEVLRVFTQRRPSVGELLASRTGRFDRVHAIVPSDAVVDESVTVTVQLWDEYERLHAADRRFRVTATDDRATVPDRVALQREDDGYATVDGLSFASPGTHYLTLTDEVTGRQFHTNPIRVHESEPDRRTLWGDIHLHSRFSDGAGSMSKGMRFGRDVMALDVVAYTDHDTMGFFIPPQLQRWLMDRSNFQEMKARTDRLDDPGEFVTLFAYEWTKQPHVGGHVNVYFRDTDGAVLFDSLAARSNTYEKLFDRLREYNAECDNEAVAISHHPAESMYPFDFAGVDYDDEVAPLVEVYSQWGSSEYPGREGNRRPVTMGSGEIDEDGHYVRDALALGNRVGMLAGSDYHGPHPGHSLVHTKPHLPSLAEWREDGIGWGHIWRVWNEPSHPGGLTAFRAESHTRDGVFDALSTRRVYGTTQPDRILVDFSLGGISVGEAGSTVEIDDPTAPRTLSIDVAGTAPIEVIEVVKNNRVWATVEGTTDPDAGLESFTLTATLTDDEPVTGMAYDDERGTEDDCYYLRVVQADGGMAWVGPLWVTVRE